MSYVTVDESGISAHSFEDILNDLKAKYRVIYGDDIYIENDSQDGQFLAIMAKAIYDTASTAIAVYNSFSPATALGEALSRNVAMNGITRNAASYSTIQVILTGVAGTIINNGLISDGMHLWRLPSSVLIDATGLVQVQAICEDIGAILATPNTITQIVTPTRGWLTVNNVEHAVIGQPIETDAQLRQRQKTSVALPSQSLLDGLVGAIADLANVTHYRAYENNSNQTDQFGIAAHSIALVVAGGEIQRIAQLIQNKKSLGCGTVGNIVRTVLDEAANPSTIRFYRPNIREIKVHITLKADTGYNDTIANKIKQSLFDYINSVGIGGQISATKLNVATALNGHADAMNYDIQSISVNGENSLTLGFRDLAVCTIADISIGVS